MINLKRTTGLQEVYLHTTGLEDASLTAVLRLYSTISGEEVAVAGVDAELLAEGGDYVLVRFALPELPQGEYRYEVRQDAKIVGGGLALVGEPTPVAAPATEGEGIGNIVIKQYGE